MAIIFNGRAFADKKLKIIKDEVVLLKTQGIYPVLASIYFSSDPASVLYTKLKKEKAKLVGIEFLDYKFSKVDFGAIITLIEILNNDPSVHGIMVQKPMGKKIISREGWQKINSKIAGEKDVDGLTDNSQFVPATVKAVLEILNIAAKQKQPQKAKPFKAKIVVVGAMGMVGEALVRELNGQNSQKFEVIGCNSQTPNFKDRVLQGDIIVSATGVANLIKADMVKDGAIVIDVG